MQGYLALVLHAHLPFVRHPEHERAFEETWLFEAITECYLPLIQVMDGWLAAGMDTRLTLSASPTLCAMLLDPLLQDRYLRHLEGLIELAERETYRTHWDASNHALAQLYHQRFQFLRHTYFQYGRNVVGAWRKFQEAGKLEIITTAATHAVLPLLAAHPPSVRAQILVARDEYRRCFGRAPRGVWLPECAYAPGVERALQEAELRWFIVDAHGLLHAQPRPRYGVYAPAYTPHGLAAFARDRESAQQVWCRQTGYPGDPRYRDFYRDIGYDVELEYLKRFLPVPDQRSFTGIKYHAISGASGPKRLYDPAAAQLAVGAHARHFLDARRQQAQRMARLMDRPALVVAPYDAELFGHWWYEGPEFLDRVARGVVFEQTDLQLTTPWEYLATHPLQQVVTPSPSSWGEEGYLKTWLNEANAWIYPHLAVAQERMTELVRRFPRADALGERALRQAGRELLLAQASDWPFILRTGTFAGYARRRVETYLLRFTQLYQQVMHAAVDAAWLSQIEAADNVYPDLDYHYWA